MLRSAITLHRTQARKHNLMTELQCELQSGDKQRHRAPARDRRDRESRRPYLVAFA